MFVQSPRIASPKEFGLYICLFCPDLVKKLISDLIDANSLEECTREFRGFILLALSVCFVYYEGGQVVYLFYRS